MVTATSAEAERAGQLRITGILLLVLILAILGGFTVQRKATVPVAADGLAVRDTAAGLAVIEVKPGSTGDRAGITRGDILTGVDGLTVTSAVQYGQALAAAGQAPENVYSLLRNGRRLNRVVRSERRPDGDLLYAGLALAGTAALLLAGLVGVFGSRAAERSLLAGIGFCFAAILILSPIGIWDRFDLLVNALDDMATVMLPVFFLGFCLHFPAPDVAAAAPVRRRLINASTCIIPALLALLFLAWYAGLSIRPGNPYTTTTMYAVLRRLSLGWLGLALSLGGLSAALRALRCADPVRRQQLLWVSLGTLTGSLPALVLYFLPYLFGVQPAAWQAWSVLGLALIPASFAVAVFRYRLADAQLVFKRSLVWSVSSALTVVVAALGLAATTRWLPGLSDPRRPSGVAFWALTAFTLAAIFFPRIRDSLARSADRLHFGERLDHRERLAAFDPFRLDPSLPPDRLVEMFMDDVVLALEVDPIRFVPPEDIPETALAPEGAGPRNRCRVVRLDSPWQGCYQLLTMTGAGGGQSLGAVAMGPRRGGSLLSSQDLEALLPAAELLAMALENSTLTSRLVEQQRLASIGQLAAGVAHEINTPLTGISSYTEMLLESLPDGAGQAAGRRDAPEGQAEEQAEMLKKIGVQAERAERIVSSLLQFARKKSGTMAATDLNAVARQAVALFEHRLKGTTIDFRFDLSPGPLPVTGDAGQLQQVLVNLMGNALEAMPDGGRLRVSVTGKDADAVLTVADSGPGIPPEVRRRIFEPFYTTKPPGSGTGLGLSICYGIIREHQGDISVASRPGAGTVFTVTLPRVNAGDADR